MIRNLSILAPALALGANVAHADAPPPSPAPVAETPGALDPNRPGKFSVGRFLVESLVGAVVGGGAAYLTYSSLCDDGDSCLGPALLGMTVNIAVTPLSVYGVGRAMGGRGTLGMTYLGGLLPFSASAGVSAQEPTAALAVSMILMPFAAAATFELVSHLRRDGEVAVMAQPVSSTGGLDGMVVGATGRF